MFITKQIRSCFLSLLALGLITSCAQIVAPTGGAKDTTPPKVGRTYPMNKTTHFNAPQIVLTFDEYIVLNNPNEQVVISPPLVKKPEFINDGKRVIIDLKGQLLKENTTYTINFGNAIGDLHENNILQNLTYVFSTGATLDSLKVSGQCINAFNLVPEKEFLVGLYALEGFSDTTVYTTQPTYFGKSKIDGSFSISNVPASRFRVLAFSDENKNLKYDKNELVGFLDHLINTEDSLNSALQLFVYKPDLYRRGKVVDTLRTFLRKFDFVIYKPTENALTVDNKVGYIKWIIRAKNNIDTIRYFNKSRDSVMSFSYKTEDSLYKIKLMTKKSASVYAFGLDYKKTIELGDTVQINFLTPVIIYDSSKVILKEDTNRVKPYYISLDELGRFIRIVYPWQEAKHYSLDIKDSCFKDLFGQFNARLNHSWTTKSLKDYSSLRLLINNPIEDQVIMQLVDEKETIVYKSFILKKQEDLLIENILPGVYKFKFIIDNNKNGIWDNGQLDKGYLPERVYYFPETVTLRAYWDLEQTMILTDFIK